MVNKKKLKKDTKLQRTYNLWRFDDRINVNCYRPEEWTQSSLRTDIAIDAAEKFHK